MQTTMTDAKHCQYFVWPFGSGELNIKLNLYFFWGRWIWSYNIWLSIRLDAILRWNMKRIFLSWKLVLVLPGRQVPHATCMIIVTRHIVSSHKRCYHNSKQTYVRVKTKLPNTKAIVRSERDNQSPKIGQVEFTTGMHRNQPYFTAHQKSRQENNHHWTISKSWLLLKKKNLVYKGSFINQ